MIRVAIVEDEKDCMEVLKDYLRKYSAKTGTKFSIDWFANGVNFIGNYEPVYDVIYMDILMPHLDGMEAAKKLRQYDGKAALIFVTNMAQYAVKGYEVDALDFIVKPVKYYDFEMKLQKALNYIEKQRSQALLIDLGDVKRRISLFEIYYIEIVDHTLIIHTTQGAFNTRGRLKRMAEELKEHNFEVCHQSYLVNLRHVLEIHPDHIIVGQDQVPMSRRCKKPFLKRLTNYLGGGL